MALPGQASGDFTESSSALRILYAGTRNTFAATLSSDGFTQTNPPVVTASNKTSNVLSSDPKKGVLGGSVAFSRGDAGNGYVGGPNTSVPAADEGKVRPLGVFINDAKGNAYENTPATASDKAPYMSGQGTYGFRLYETQDLNDGTNLSWEIGDAVYASQNGYLTNLDDANNAHERTANYASGGAAGSSTVIGVVTVTPDSQHSELVIDQRI